LRYLTARKSKRGGLFGDSPCAHRRFVERKSKTVKAMARPGGRRPFRTSSTRRGRQAPLFSDFGFEKAFELLEIDEVSDCGQIKVLQQK
jgi:hypothetical protein